MRNLRKKENKGLPSRWAYKHGAYYYRPKEREKSFFDNKAWFRLGKTLAEAHKQYSSRIEFDGDLNTLNQVCDRYSLEILIEKAPATQKSQARSMKRIKAALGVNLIQSIESHHIYQYRDAVKNKFSKKSANLDLEVLSHVFTKAIEWGARRRHPMTNKQVTKYSLPARDRYVEDWELDEFLSVASPFVLGYTLLKGLTGLDKGDLLSIKSEAAGKDGLTIAARKKNKSKLKNNRERFFPYVDSEGESTGILEVLEFIKGLRGRPIQADSLFCTTVGKNRGRPYIKEDGSTSGFDSIWQRCMKKALDQTKLEDKFTEHDLRAKVGSDAETDGEAQRQLDHSTPQMTRKAYRRKAIKMPVAKGFKVDLNEIS